MSRRFDLATDAPAAPEEDFPAEALFADAKTAVLVAVEATGRVVAVNPAAERLLGMTGSRLVGHHWLRAFGDDCVQQLARAARQAATSGTAVRTVASRPAGGAAVTAIFTTFCVSKFSYLLVRLTGDTAGPARPEAIPTDVLDALDALTAGFVVTDGALHIEYANTAFLACLGLSSQADVEHQSLLRWLNLSQADLLGMNRQMALREAGTLITTKLRAGPATERVVEITAIAVPDASCPRWGFVVQTVVQH